MRKRFKSNMCWCSSNEELSKVIVKRHKESISMMSVTEAKHPYLKVFGEWKQVSQDVADKAKLEGFNVLYK